MMKRIVWFTVFSVGLLSHMVIAQGNSYPDFEISTSQSLLEFGEVIDHSQLNNQGQYLYRHNYSEIASIRNLSNHEVVYQAVYGIRREGGWSSDGQKFVMAYDHRNETYQLPFGQSRLEIFDGVTRTTTTLEIPFAEIETISWSPFSSEEVLLNQAVILNIQTQAQTPVSVNPLPNLDEIDFVLFQDVVWDRATGLPVGYIDYYKDTESSTNFLTPSPQGGEYVIAEFRLCTFDKRSCQTVYDNLTGVQAVVFGWDFSLATNWMLWGGYEIPENQTFSWLPSENLKENGVIYLTDLRTGETNEILRFSSLRLEDTQPVDIDWSPDGSSILIMTESLYTPSSRPPVLINLSWADNE